MEPKEVPSFLTGEEIVISGISGRFPKSANFEQLWRNLIEGKDCLSDEPRWSKHIEGVPKKIGLYDNPVNKFDRVFFGMHPSLTEVTDPMTRFVVECSFEAFADAGLHPRELEGSRTAVFTCGSYSESEKVIFYEKMKRHCHSITGLAKTMMANRISFYFGFIGPSAALDSSDTSTATALEEAYRVIKSGECDSAIIAGSTFCLHPHVSKALLSLDFYSADGYTKSFDANAKGCTRSESTCVIVLQRAKNAKRIYAELVNVYGATEGVGLREMNSCLFPKAETQAKIMRRTLKMSGLSPSDISFIEADGSGIKNNDVEEVKAIDSVYANGRSSPLLIGSVKSNIGHASYPSPLNSLCKVIVAMNANSIPPNLHYNSPNPDIDALMENRIKVVDKLTTWSGNYAAINAISFGGTFIHAILKAYRNPKTPIKSIPQDDLPRLLVASGRNEAAIEHIFSTLENAQIDVEHLQLLNDVFKKEINGHVCRGYAILSPKGPTQKINREFKPTSGVKKDVWFVFSGMGSQWNGMGESLMQLPIFRKSMIYLDSILKPKGIDIVKVICDKDPEIFDNILHCFVGIAAIQIGLVDVLNALNIIPNYIIGHSTGELGCAYADGCLTAEQMILAAYTRGKVSLETKLPKGLMAAIGVGYEKLKPLCPADIDIACHNGPDSSTISGPYESVEEFVKLLTSKGIFARGVASANLAFHSRYIAVVEQKSLEYLSSIVPYPKRRSQKWLSTCVTDTEWNEDHCQIIGPQYITDNMLKPVLFEEVLRKVPKDIVAIEIAPHGLLQSILRRSLPKSCINIPLTMRDHSNSLEFLLTSVGKIYNTGVNPHIEALYPKVHYPVSVGTPSIASLIKWDHSDDCTTYVYKEQCPSSMGSREITVNLNEKEHAYMKDYKIGGVIVLPISFYLHNIIDIMKEIGQKENVSVMFQDIQVLKGFLQIPENNILNLCFVIFKGSGQFEVTLENETLVTGKVYVEQNLQRHFIDMPESEDIVHLNDSDFYTELEMRGYNYAGKFKNIKSCSYNAVNACVKSPDNWTTLFDALFQIAIFKNHDRQLQYPKSIEKIVYNSEINNSSLKELKIEFNEQLNIISIPGLQLQGIKLTNSVVKDADAAVIKELKFVPNQNNMKFSLLEATELALQVMFENVEKSKKKIIEFTEMESQEAVEMSKIIYNNFNQEDIVIYDGGKHLNESGRDKVDLMIVSRHSTKKNYQLIEQISESGFLLASVDFDNLSTILQAIKDHELKVILRKELDDNCYLLLARKTARLNDSKIVKLTTEQSDWTGLLKAAIMSSTCERVFLLTNEKTPRDKILNLIKSENYRKKLRILDVRDKNNVKLSYGKDIYKTQMDQDLIHNVLQEGNIWGTYRALPIYKNLANATRWVARQMERGDPSTVTWVESPPTYKNKEVIVKYTSLNSSDLAEAQCKSNVNQTFGLEYSGINSDGQRVMGMLSNGTLKSHLTPDPTYIWQVPKNWTLEEASTVPLAYSIAYYALLVAAKLQKGDKILIHNGSSDIGQAVIQVALNNNCKVYTTYKTDGDKKLIEATYPSIASNQIYHFSNFSDKIMLETNKSGVNFIICHAHETECIEPSLDCAATYAKCVIVGNLNSAMHKSVGMQCFLNSIVLSSVNVKKLFSAKNSIKQILAGILQKSIDAGLVVPITHRIYDAHSIKEAFVENIHNKFHGKILIRTHPHESSKMMQVMPIYYCSPKSTYLLVEGNCNFGFEMAQWLVSRGAKNIIITSSKPESTNGYMERLLFSWRKLKVNVIIRNNTDLSDSENARNLLKEITSIGEVDMILDIQRIKQENEPSESLYRVTENLHEASKLLCHSLKKFAICVNDKNFYKNKSHITFENAEITRLCEDRIRGGLHAIVIRWGNQSVAECIRPLDTFLTLKGPAAFSFVRNIERTKV